VISFYFLLKKLTVPGTSGILAYLNETIHPALSSDVASEFGVMVNCMLKA
jgi:hypothetical protein